MLKARGGHLALRTLFISIVEPEGPRAVKGGATTVTRGLLRHLREEGATVDVAANHVLPPKAARKRQVSSLLRGALTGRPAKAFYQENAALRGRIGALMAEHRYGRVIANGSDLFALAADAAARMGAELWIVVHNIEGDLYGSQMESLPAMARFLLKRDLSALRREEARAYREADRLLVLCEADRERIVGLTGVPGSKIALEPVRFEGRPYHERAGPRPAPAPGTPLGLVMLGDFGWWPNAEGAAWFASEVWPRLSPRFSLDLFGRGSETVLAGTEGPVRGHGVAEHLDGVWRAADLMISPVFRGAGVRIKNAEAVWNGLPLLTNALGMRGVDTDGSRPIFLAETAEEWAAALERIADDPSLLSHAGPHP